MKDALDLSYKAFKTLPLIYERFSEFQPVGAGDWLASGPVGR
jgi:hypothetical protein